MKKAYMHKKLPKKWICSTYFGLCLRAIFNSDIFEKLSVFYIPKLKLGNPQTSSKKSRTNSLFWYFLMHICLFHVCLRWCTFILTFLNEIWPFSMQICHLICPSRGVSRLQNVLKFKNIWIWSEGGRDRFFQQYLELEISEIQNF